MIFFVHIPKTAGTSFREGLLHVIPREKALFDYGPDAPETDAAIRRLYHDKEFTPQRVAEIAAAENITVISGHFPLARYRKVFPGTTVISFIREPLQRCYSEYLHWQRHKNYQGSFEEFIQRKDQVNLQSRWLDGLPQNSIVGISEYYATSVQLINATIDLSIPTLTLNCHRKKTDQWYGEDIDIISSDLAAMFYEMNKADLELYNEHLAIFKEKVSGLNLMDGARAFSAMGSRISFFIKKWTDKFTLHSK